MSKKLLAGASLAVTMFTVTACGEADVDDAAGAPAEQEAAEEQGTAQPEAPEPDLAGIPDVVAEVNGEEIAKEDFVARYEGQFQQVAQQAQMSGQEVDQEQLKEQTAEGMVSTELLVQEADARGYTVSDADVEEVLDELATANGLQSTDEVLSALTAQGMTEDEVYSELRTQVEIDRLIAEEMGSTEPTEEELRALYDEATALQGESGGEAAELPSFEEVRPQLEQQVQAENESEATQELVTDLRADADVTIYL